MHFITYALAILFITVNSLYSQQYIADHTVAKESVLRSIPNQYIALAREKYKIAYQHTSHGTHVAYGMFGLPDYKSGDDTLFAISNGGTSEPGKLHFMDCYSAPSNRCLKNYGESGVDASDLSRNETAFIQATRNFLDASVNSDVNVIMWSWCSIRDHKVSENYLPGMDSLIAEYSEGGTNPRASINPVTFIFFTGHAESRGNVGSGRPADQAKLITDHCVANNYYCLDYFGIDAHDMEDNYYEDASDNGTSNDYGGSFYGDWQSANNLGEAWYENKTTPGGSVGFGSHTTQHITSNRKAYATWWILARMAGWSGEDTDISIQKASLINKTTPISKLLIQENNITITFNSKSSIKAAIVSLSGKTIRTHSSINKKEWILSTSNFSNGTYLLNVTDNIGNHWAKRFVITN